ncbi:hypothetical protein CJ030_MR7G017815 [Morella rubra]|uniref:Uncharacterized protein n=1 Tax=Morella rubra TaxID=262757 RepID=A0A6A1UZ50_9ROSI|nr:hypothetical protein CJ030_MR7G017815 [Morella rubra]
MANVGGSSSGAIRVPRVPERREGHWGPSQMVEANFKAFYTEYRFPRKTHFRLPSDDETPYTNGAKGEMCFFEAPLKSGWERFPSEDHQSESSMRRAFGSIPDHHRREITSLTTTEKAHVDAILEASSINWNALVCNENEGWLVYTMSGPSPRANPSPRHEKSSRECPLQ